MEESNERDIIEKRKENIIKFLKTSQVWVIGILILALILGVYIRSMPMHDHGGVPGLWDITKNDWTLGPDLDPWLFTRIAGEIIEKGSIPIMDTMRNVPLGFDNSGETVLLPYMISWTYKFFNLFGNYSIEFAAAIFPVIMFALTIIAFFLFVREIFIRKSKESKIKANIISLISTFFMIVMPVFLSRTIAGIPEKESAAFFFMFLSFYLFLKAWKSKEIKKAIIFGILAGIATAGMGLISGLLAYIYITIFVASFIAFILNKIQKKEIIIYSSWWISAAILLSILPGKVTFKGLITSFTISPAFFLLILILIHLLLWETKISKNQYLERIKLPKNIISILITLIFTFISIIILDPNLIVEKFNAIMNTLFEPVTGRWNTTVAENKQPYFAEWVRNFGPFLEKIGKIPLMFWLFFTGAIILFKKMLKKINEKESLILTGLFIFFLFGLMFSRYSPSSLFNGENFISKSFYLISAGLFLGYLIFYYIQYHKENHLGFEKISYEYLFLFSLFIITLFTARSGVRLIMVLGPISTIFVGFLIIESLDKFKQSKNETKKIIFGIFMVIIILSSLFTFWSFYKSVKYQAYGSIPSHYNQQWQKAMDWTRENTPADAVFGHWWDYGYWVQSIGERATVLDGGNAMSFWNYWMGRLVLTGDNQKDALEFLYNHDTTHFLIDSSDIGKYGAFSSIGSDENYDRFSWIGTFLLDEKQTQETKNQTIYIYPGGISLDEDLIINNSGQDILLPQQKAGIGAIIIPTSIIQNQTNYLQPYTIMFYQGIQHKVYLRYLATEKDFIDFGSGIEACAYLFPNIIQQGQGIGANPIGAVMYLSPRLMRGMLVQKYILNDPFNEFPNFKITHIEQNLIIENLNNQGMNLPEFTYYQGIQGPIKIWEIEYTGKEKIKEKYLDKDSSKYLSWKL
jgi:asparagine N-glycosylation enzyme membrane subunit Stt3